MSKINSCFKIFFIFLLLIYYSKATGQSFEIYNNKNNKVKQFEVGDKIEINYSTPGQTLIFPHAVFTYTSESAQFKIEEMGVEKMKVSYNFPKYTYHTTLYDDNNSNASIFTYDAKVQESFYIQYNNINAIYIPKKGSEIIAAIGVIGVTGFIISPLIAINYNEWEINSNRYFISAGISLGLIGIAWLGSAIVKEKTYYFNDDGKNKFFTPEEEGYWKLNYLNDRK